ncbi:prepilin-type N-terminal cleavage/methylation domain-containing protein [Blastopirellula sp. JC732]|uniref:Prepilin-type N-terminal cleavage/methylation domain-containing protein n=1 Tax=Blastopirellula sediminis TaxID=2894196 RepID=A0A9X1MKG5_9BACT|nr:prepilin-type N-terminal cleavage/methylation domain-containing protein [Blastopirellula sediminis]MCC9609303.1 prepilin-type N-terminal cleavage/methylation domain-containing protein [Blastopirellula sediminis]MCC9627920.1 prepilin-type N-terminal cleavage/methylation domain-containing protein [Blastopirellula sediminis]
MIGLKFTAAPNRRGVTLVELLVVVTLLSILLGIAATAARTGTRGKKQREAARQVNAFLAGARTRAVELGRSVGVEIVNNRPNEPQAGITLFMVETPPAYAGDTTSAVCEMTEKPSAALGGRTATLRFNISTTSLLYDDNFLKVNDVVFLGYSKQPYRVAQVNPLDNMSTPVTRSVVIAWNVDQPAPLSWIGASGVFMAPYPTSTFRIYRQPQRNNVSPLQMPTGSCIDLLFSGLGTTGQELRSYDDTNSAVPDESYPKIMFSPNGTVDAFYVQPKGTAATTSIATASGLPTGNINLLIGRYEKVIAVREAGFNGVSIASAGNAATGPIYAIFNSPSSNETNIADPEAFWVSINRLTGHIVTSNNAMVNDPASSPSDDALLAAARRFAKQAQSISGR